MSLTIAVIAPGAMGSAVGGRLTARGAKVTTLLEGRSAITVDRAKAAGMIGVVEAEIVAADLILSILPPADALPLARRLAPFLEAAGRKPVYVDCNAVSPATVKTIEAVILAAGAPFADAGIIGGPPRGDGPGPAFYLSGAEDRTIADLQGLGLRARALSGPVGAASSLKMSYAGMTKGLTALGATMLEAASRAGVEEALRQELFESQAALLKRFQAQIPDMYPKAYRWVEEMRQIAEFLGPQAPGGLMFEGAAAVYDRLADDVAGEGEIVKTLDAFLKTPPG